ncbi:MAG: HAMP domain-containing protein [bacterium]|nr:HAMP domain-containing protein [bacterium]
MENRKRIAFISLRVKLLIGFTLLFSVVFAAAFYWFLTFATDSALHRVELDMIATLDAAVEGIDGNEFESLATEGSGDDPRYAQHIDWLRTVHSIEPRAFIYTYVAGNEPNQILFIGDTLQFVRPDDAAAFGDPYTSTGPLIRGLNDLTFNLVPYSDQWGSWISAYKPIVNSGGERVGAMGIDFEAAYVAEVRQGILNSIVIAFAGTYALLFLMVYLISQVVTRPVAALKGVAERIAEGDYNQNLSHIGSARFPDEMYSLARVFQIMVDKVRVREETLKKEVAELRIELDEAKRNEQVSQIVDSDFFRDLQEKAKMMRARKGGGAEAASLLDSLVTSEPT